MIETNDWIVFRDDVEGGITMPFQVNISFTHFERLFEIGEGGEMMRYDEITEWLSLKDFKVQYLIEPYAGCILGFETQDQWFEFKMRWS